MTADDIAYAELCVGCWREKLCHEDLEYCDAYLEMEDKEGEDE